jgi:SAM-dependent methyltransferase
MAECIHIDSRLEAPQDMTMERDFYVPTRLKTLFRNTYLNPLHIARSSLRRLLATASAEVRGRTLDLGCGGKRYAALFPDVSRSIFLDLPSNSASEKNVTVWGDGRSLPFRSGVFDSVLCTEVIEHVPTPDRVFAEAYRVLRPGGHLVLTTPQTWGLHEVPHDYYRYTEYGLRFLAETAGFRVERVEPTCGIWATVGQRLSSFFFFEFGVRRNLAVQAAVAVACAAAQMTFAGLDVLFGHRGDPLDHLLIARKNY